MDKIVEKAFKISIRALKKCGDKHGFFAARNHFRNYWARDAFFSSFGAVYVDEFARVKKQLQLFIKYQKKNGHIPRLIWRNIFVRILFTTLEKPFSNFSPFLTYFSRDQNSLFVISAWEYIKKSKDYEFARKHFDSFERAVNWNFIHDIDKDLILEQGAYADWEDTIAKNPEGLFTNVCNYKGLLCLSEIASLIGLKVKKKQYLSLAKIVKQEINQKFWTGDFYTDSLKVAETAKQQKDPIFAGGANMLAIYWELANMQKSKRIMAYVKEHNLEHFSIEVNHPLYPENRVLVFFRMLRMKEYHNGMEWLWIGCAGVLAYLKMGEKRKARHLLRKIARKIVEYKEVYEVYEPTGEPVNRTYYKSAYPFAWSAGMFIYTIEKMGK